MRQARRARVASLVGAANVLVFSALVAEQAVEWSTTWDAADLAWWVGGVTLVIGLLLVAVVTAVSLVVSSWWVRIVVAVVLSAAQAVVRMLLLLPATTALDTDGPGGIAIWASGTLGYSVALGAGFLVAALLAREDHERALREAEQSRARAAVDDLEHEELRVRRLVADRLHGTIQHRLVVIAAGLDRLSGELDEPARSRWAPSLREWAEELDELREEDVRSLSHALFPSGADLGTYEAVRVLLDRLPASVATSVRLGPTMRRLVETHRAPLPLLDRLVVVYTVEEAVTNALKHGGATAVAITAEVRPLDGPAEPAGRWVIDVVVDDDGRGPGEAEPGLSGLARHRARAAARGGSLTLTTNDDGGGRLHLVLPFTPEADLR